MKQSDLSDYMKTLPLAKEICKRLLGEPKTHHEGANRFNIEGDINRLIMDSKNYQAH